MSSLATHLDSIADSSREGAATRIAKILGDTPKRIEPLLRQLDEYGPLAHYYLFESMRKPTSASSDREALVLKLRFIMVIDSICGRRPHMRTRTLALDKFMCVNCRYYVTHNFRELAVDHKVPRIRGGTNNQSNLQTLCRPCNSSKGALTPDEWELTGLAQMQRDQRPQYADR